MLLYIYIYIYVHIYVYDVYLNIYNSCVIVHDQRRLMGLVNWIHVFGTYLPILWFFVVGILMFQLSSILYEMRFDLQQFYNSEVATLSLTKPVALDLGWKTMALLALLYGM